MTGTLPLDELDRKLLRLLAEDGRRSYAELARDTGLSTRAVHQRVRRLEQRGAVRLRGPDRPGDGRATAVGVHLDPADRPAAPDDAAQRLRHLSAIEACHSVAGEESYIMQVRVATG